MHPLARNAKWISLHGSRRVSTPLTDVKEKLQMDKYRIPFFKALARVSVAATQVCLF